MKKFIMISIILVFFLLYVTNLSFALSPPPRAIWQISDFSRVMFFNGILFYVDHDNPAIFPDEMGWEGRNVTLRFDLRQEDFITNKFDFRFNVPYRNYANKPDVILKISAGSKTKGMKIIVQNFTITRLGLFSIPINASYFSAGNENYINIYGVNIDCVGYGCLSSNFQWSWISLNLYGNLTAPNITDTELLDQTEAYAAKYFYEQNLPNGFVKDVTNTPWSSIAATGFGLSVFTIMAQRFNTSQYWNYTPEQLRNRTNLILDNFIDIQNKQKNDSSKYGVAGFFYHFIDSNGERQGTSEVSTVDTAILTAGAITAGEYFGGEVKQKAETIFNNLNWSFFFNPTKKQFSHGWSPESGLFTQTWDRPSDETMLVTLLAIASQPDNTEFQKSFYSWPRVARTYSNYTVINSYFGSIFTYEFAHIWFDFQRLGYDSPSDANMSTTSVNWWNNSINATLASRQFSIDNAVNYSNYGENSWGLTACQKPSGAYEGLYGAKPCEYNSGNCYHDGTICPYGSISAMPFFEKNLSENLAFKTLRNYYDKYYWDLWGEYGPRDSFDQYGSFNMNYLGIDVGPEVAMIENHRTGFVWRYFMRNEKIIPAVMKIFPNMAKPESTGHVRIMNGMLYIDNKPYQIKGIAYQPTPIGQNVEWGYNPLLHPELYNRDFPILKLMHANTIRTWGKIPTADFLDKAAANNLHVVMGFWIDYNADLSNNITRQNIINEFKTYVASFKNHSAVLMWAIGNENNYYQNPTLFYSLANELAKEAYIIEGASYHPVTIVNGEIFSIPNDSDVNYIDVWGINSYRGYSFGDLFNDYKTKSNKPLWISEYGIDAYNMTCGCEYQDIQAQYDLHMWREIANNSLGESSLGGAIMEYSDEWWKAGNPSSHDTGGFFGGDQPDNYKNEEWWGIVAVQKNGTNPDIVIPRQVYYAFKEEWRTPCPGDVNNNNVVDIFDLAKVGICFNCRCGDACWDSCATADVKQDCSINIFDLATVGLNFGKTC